ncbi:LysR substrate-binding domain-containing protein [Haliangium sp.]|uniref:LysR substrate-binding domain-containing protein n=1 Tax=Haliangium sp. TaxID=2663208 RepID=UPI003D0B63A7
MAGDEPSADDHLGLEVGPGAPRWRAGVDGAASGPEPLGDLPVAAYDDKAPIVRRYWREVLGARPPARLALVAPDVRALREVLCTGAAISVLPVYLIRAELSEGALVELLPGRRPAPNRFWLATRRQGPRGERAARVLAWLQQRAPALSARMR